MIKLKSILSEIQMVRPSNVTIDMVINEWNKIYYIGLSLEKADELDKIVKKYKIIDSNSDILFGNMNGINRVGLPYYEDRMYINAYGDKTYSDSNEKLIKLKLGDKNSRIESLYNELKNFVNNLDPNDPNISKNYDEGNNELDEIKLFNKVTPEMVTNLYYELDELGYGDEMFETMSQEELIKYLTPQGLLHFYNKLMKLKNHPNISESI